MIISGAKFSLIISATNNDSITKLLNSKDEIGSPIEGIKKPNAVVSIITPNILKESEVKGCKLNLK